MLRIANRFARLGRICSAGKLLLAGILLFSAAGCASDPKEVRPHLDGLPGLYLATGRLIYVLHVSPAKAHETVESVLRHDFDDLHVRANEKADLEQYNRYSEISSEFRYYQDAGRKYRKKCNAMIYLIPDYPEYTSVEVSCVLDVYELGLVHGRGGVHNLFSQGWDWYPARGLYKAEDILEAVSRKLELKEAEIIRLNKKDFYTDEEIRQLIGERQKTGSGSN